MKFAVIGKGFIFERHRQAIEKLGHELTLTCDIDPAKQADYLDWAEMFNPTKRNCFELKSPRFQNLKCFRQQRIHRPHE